MSLAFVSHLQSLLMRSNLFMVLSTFLKTSFEKVDFDVL